MTAKRRAMGRRDFLHGATGAVLAGVASMSCQSKSKDRPADQSAESTTADRGGARSPTARVVLVRHVDALDADRRPRPEILQRMLDDAVVELLGEPDAPQAFKRLVRPADTVGIKSNVWDPIRTPPELEEALRKRVLGAGVAADRVAVDDRGVRSNPVFQQATALINVRPLRTHHWAGIGSCIKNYIVFAANPSSYHGDSCASLASLWSLPQVKGKTRLNILVMLTPQFHSKGPHNYQKRYTWEYKGLLVGKDPVAVDAIGLRILQAKRREHFGVHRPLYVPAKHVEIAETRYRLGVADINRIELRKLGWMEGSLI